MSITQKDLFPECPYEEERISEPAECMYYAQGDCPLWKNGDCKHEDYYDDEQSNNMKALDIHERIGKEN
jgi:hypothetical protein